MYVRSTYRGQTCSMTCPKLFRFHSVTIRKIHHMQISHVSEEPFWTPLSEGISTERVKCNALNEWLHYCITNCTIRLVWQKCWKTNISWMQKKTTQWLGQVFLLGWKDLVILIWIDGHFLTHSHRNGLTCTWKVVLFEMFSSNLNTTRGNNRVYQDLGNCVRI